METKPYRIRIRRPRDNVLVDLMVPLGRGKFSVVETVDVGPVPLREALVNLQFADLKNAPRLKALLIPEVT